MRFGFGQAQEGVEELDAGNREGREGLGVHEGAAEGFIGKDLWMGREGPQDPYPRDVDGGVSDE